MLVGFSLVITMVFLVIIATISVMTLRLFLQHSAQFSQWASIVGGIMNAVSIMILNKIYRVVAVKLNDWENHRTESDYENALLVKIFLFQFANCYTSLYYIAFFKRTAYLWGSNALGDTCSGSTDLDQWGWGCPNDLQLQLISLLGTNIVVGQTSEVLLPWLTAKLKTWWFARSSHSSTADLPKYEREYELSPYEGTVDEYCEMVIQYGYITLFAASFPLAPLMALINNLIEIRTDAFKFLSSYNKPFYQGAENIGGWFPILEVLGVVGVLTNCLLIGFTFPTIHSLSGSLFTIFVTIVILEHVVLFGKYMVSVLVPDMPIQVRKEIAKQVYIQQQIIKKYEQKAPVSKNIAYTGESIGQDL